MDEDGQIFHAQRGDHWVLRVEGALRYTNANALDHFIDGLFAGGRAVSVSVDLNAATAIDSTGIGLLAKIADRMGRAGRGQPVLFSARADINELLTSVCLDEVCHIVPELDCAGPAEPIPATHPDEAALARTIADAHRLLCALSADNYTQFHGVVEAFEREASPPHDY